MAGLSSRLGRIATPRTAVFVCDMQEKFRHGIKYFPEIVTNTKRVLGAAKILDLPVVYTEQYPKGIPPSSPKQPDW